MIAAYKKVTYKETEGEMKLERLRRKDILQNKRTRTKRFQEYIASEACQIEWDFAQRSLGRGNLNSPAPQIFKN